MYQFRVMLAIVVACTAFVGIAAALKASDPSLSGSLVAGASEAISAAQQDLGIDSSFFATTTPEAKASDPIAAAPADPVSAEAYLVGDVSTGKIYLEKNSQEVLPFASMSKLITALVATDIYPLDKVIVISTSSTEVPPDASNLRAGESFTVKELLYPMLMSSSNVAAEALASASSTRIRFLESMSSYAWEIGMPNSFFADPTGLSPRNAGTARGFFAMAQYLYSQRPDILAITRTQELAVATTSGHGSHDFTSIHPFVNDPRFLGGKTGHTDEALDTMLTIMKIGGHPIAVIVLHSVNQRAQDTSLLLDRATKMLATD